MESTSTNISFIYGDELTETMLKMQQNDDDSENEVTEEQKVENTALIKEFKDLQKQLT